jgi:hypothetical protein
VLTYLITNSSDMASGKARQSQAARSESADYVKAVAAPGGAARRDREG